MPQTLIDDKLDEALGSVDAVVNLGAGMDTRGYDSSRAYVTNQQSNKVSIIRTSDNSLIDTVTVGQSPTEAAVSGTKVYVSNYGDGTVTAIDTANANTTSTIALTPGAQATGIVVNPSAQRQRAYVATGNGPIEVIDTSTGATLDRILFGGSNKLAVSPDGKYLYATVGNTVAEFRREHRRRHVDRPACHHNTQHPGDDAEHRHRLHSRRPVQLRRRDRAQRALRVRHERDRQHGDRAQVDAVAALLRFR
jgi:YVTN family beta-propeller protein